MYCSCSTSSHPETLSSCNRQAIDGQGGDSVPGFGLEGWGEALGLSMQNLAPRSSNHTRHKAAGLAERGNRLPMWIDR